MKEHGFVLLSTQKENKLTFPRRKVEVDVYLCVSYFSESPSKQLAGAGDQAGDEGATLGSAVTVRVLQRRCGT